jgi:hypothetical protein
MPHSSIKINLDTFHKYASLPHCARQFALDFNETGI